MKTSFAISMNDSSFESIAKGDWRRNLALMSEMGFDGVELGLKNPGECETDELISMLNTYQLEVAAIGTGQAYLDEGLTISSENKRVCLNAVNRVKDYIKLAVLLRTRIVIGLIRGNLGKNQNERKRKKGIFVNSMREIAAFAKKNKVDILIEPLNRYESDFLNRAEETIKIINEIKYSNIKLLLDTFHMNIEEKDMESLFIKYADWVGHIHIADSNRRYPGSGHIDFKSIIKMLKKIDYEGFLSGEILPWPDLLNAMRNYYNEIGGMIK